MRGRTVRTHLKRWTGAYVGWVSRSSGSEDGKNRVADGSRRGGRHPRGPGNASASGPAESKTPRMHRNWAPSGHARTERPRGHPWSVGQGTLGEGDEL